MINVTLKRSLVTLAVTAGLLFAAGSAGASPTKHEPASSPASARAPLAIELENTMVNNYLPVTMEDILVTS
jgi:hypothetical protein